MSLHEIVLPETKPETEWVRGRALQKVSPTYSHGALQLLLGNAVLEWTERTNQGRVGTEWRFRVSPPGEITRPLVPDVAFLSYDALAATAARAIVEVPLMAPTVAFEVLSPDDRRADVDDKIATYLRAGCAAVVVVDPRRTAIELHDCSGSRTSRAGDVLALDALPGFALDVEGFFARAMR